MVWEDAMKLERKPDGLAQFHILCSENHKKIVYYAVVFDLSKFTVLMVFPIPIKWGSEYIATDVTTLSVQVNFLNDVHCSRNPYFIPPKEKVPLN